MILERLINILLDSVGLTYDGMLGETKRFEVMLQPGGIYQHDTLILDIYLLSNDIGI